MIPSRLPLVMRALPVSSVRPAQLVLPNLRVALLRRRVLAVP
jgi:hypothetical protein